MKYGKDLARLRDVVAWSRKAVGYLEDRSEQDFLSNELLKDGCVRCIEVVGEAVAHISGEFRDLHPSVPWREAKGMRDILIHQYGSVDFDIVYETIVTFLPSLIAQVETILNGIEP
jgi:uncharacterized protein with HEPN domain